MSSLINAHGSASFISILTHFVFIDLLGTLIDNKMKKLFDFLLVSECNHEGKKQTACDAPPSVLLFGANISSMRKLELT